MKDYYSLFVQECSKLCRISDFSDPKRVHLHNESMKRINHLKEDLIKYGRSDILYELMRYKDEMVQMNAAAICLQLGIYIDEALIVLSRIEKETTDKSIQFTCKTLLRNSL